VAQAQEGPHVHCGLQTQTCCTTAFWQPQPQPWPEQVEQRQVSWFTGFIKKVLRVFDGEMSSMGGLSVMLLLSARRLRRVVSLGARAIAWLDRMVRAGFLAENTVAPSPEPFGRRNTPLPVRTRPVIAMRYRWRSFATTVHSSKGMFPCTTT